LSSAKRKQSSNISQTDMRTLYTYKLINCSLGCALLGV